MPAGLGSLAVVAVVAALAPLVAGFLRGWIPQVGLLLLFLLAGYELDLQVFRERAGRLAITGWAVSIAIAMVLVGVLYAFDVVHDYAVAAIALTTTALGTLLPILRDNDMLGGRLGRYFFAAGAVGELAPILAIAIFLGSSGSLLEIVLLFVFGGIAYLAVIAPRQFAGTRVARIVMAGEHATAQTTLRFTLALLLVLLFVAAEFGFDVVLGAFVAGVVVRHWAPGDVASLEGKLAAVAYGFFIPIFFVCSGATLDIRAVFDTPTLPFMLLAALLVVRGAPSLLLYRRALPLVERVQMTFLTATALPLLVALTTIAVSAGEMLSSTAASLVSAGVLSVLFFPLVAVVLRRREHRVVPADGAGSAGTNVGRIDELEL